MKTRMTINSPVSAAICSTLLAAASSAHAYLGGLENQDGYVGFVTWVNGYNAGQFGTNSGGPGGSMTMGGGSNPPTIDFAGGLWSDINGYFSTYNASGFSGGYYVTGHTAVPGLGMIPHSDSQMLALRNTGYNSTSNPAKPLDFRYQLDQRDLYNNGSPIAPTATGNMIVDWNIWISPGPARINDNAGVWLSIKDSNGSIAFQFGWDGLYKLRYRDKPGDPWTNTNYVIGLPWNPNVNGAVQYSVYDDFGFTIDLLHDTWSLNVLSGIDGQTRPFVVNRPFGVNLSDFTTIDWHMSYGNDKGFFDDSIFVLREAVPEPTTLALVGVAGLLLMGARPRIKRAKEMQDQTRDVR